MKQSSKEVSLLKRQEKKTHGKAGDAAHVGAVPNEQTGLTPGPWFANRYRGTKQPITKLPDASLASLGARLKKEPIAFQAETQTTVEQPSEQTGITLCPSCKRSDLIDGDVLDGHSWCHRCQLKFKIKNRA